MKKKKKMIYDFVSAAFVSDIDLLVFFMQWKKMLIYKLWALP